MTKRSGKFDDVTRKRQKFDNNFDDLWGDDELELDEVTLNDCFELATQVCENKETISSQNVSILPTYSAFKEPRALICSTQFEKSITTHTLPSSSKVDEYEIQIKRLHQQCAEKEGEVTILRNQLKEIRNLNQAEFLKRQAEWKEKLNLSLREVKSAKSELEFKNLEIANLKQKVLEISKVKHNLEASQVNAPQNSPKKARVENKSLPSTSKLFRSIEHHTIPYNLHEGSYKIQGSVGPIYPLKLISPSIFENVSQEKYLIETKYVYCRNTILYLQNQASHDEINGPKNLKPHPLMINNRELQLDYIYPEITVLINCTLDEINSTKHNGKINKIVCVSLHLLNETYNYLKHVENHCRTESIQQSDSLYLKSNIPPNFKLTDASSFDEDELGIKAGHSVNLINELVMCNDYLKNYMFCNKPLTFADSEEYKDYFSEILPKTMNTDEFTYLSLLLNIVSVSGRIRKSHVMSSFFCSVVNLLINVCKLQMYTIVQDIFCKICHEILYARPKICVVYRLTFLFEIASQNSGFLQFLCKKPGRSTLKTNPKEGITYILQGSCHFNIFVMLFENTISKISHKNMPLNVCINIFSFIYNTFQSPSWIYYQDSEKCECLPQLYKLVMEIMYKALEKVKEEQKKGVKIPDDWKEFLKLMVKIKVLNLLIFNSYELTEKYVTVYSQFKEIINIIESQVLCDVPEDIVKDLEAININEYLPSIPNSSFPNIDF